MKKFNFRLEKILKLRKFAEEECKIALGQAISILNAIENNIQETALRRHHAASQRFEVPTEILAWDIYISRLDREAERLTEQAAQAELVVEEKRAQYMEASRDLKAIEKLKEKRLEEYKKEVQVYETAEFEDISAASMVAASD